MRDSTEVANVTGSERGGSWHTLILGHDSSSNALGRALSMALVAEQIGPVNVLAASRGKIWRGAAQFDLPVELIEPRSMQNVMKIAASAAAASDHVLVWVCKGIDPLPRIVRAILRVAPQAIVVLDLDDDDAGLAEGFRNGSLTNALKLNVLRAMHPMRIRAAQRILSSIATGTTTATDAVAAELRVKGPRLRVPHTRVEQLVVPTPAPISAKIRVGAFGTIRPHKGGTLLMNLIHDYPDLELITFRDCGLGRPGLEQTNWI
ncbi:MAG: glycosyltransferase family 1 protein, partial [Marmoricola sp.]|nr:glycosyltransferase family 1 protein [Marmoricola sp.]